MKLPEALPAMRAEEQHALAWDARLQDSLDGSLDDDERLVWQSHLQGCDTCRRRRMALEQLDQALLQATAHVALDENFDGKVLARIAALDASRRAAARRKLEQEFAAQLALLSRNWRGTLALLVPGALAGIAVASALGTWIEQTGLIGALTAQSASALDGELIQLLRPWLDELSGAVLGLGLARWLATLIE